MRTSPILTKAFSVGAILCLLVVYYLSRDTRYLLVLASVISVGLIFYITARKPDQHKVGHCCLRRARFGIVTVFGIMLMWTASMWLGCQTTFCPRKKYEALLCGGNLVFVSSKSTNIPSSGPLRVRMLRCRPNWRGGLSMPRYHEITLIGPDPFERIWILPLWMVALAVGGVTVIIAWRPLARSKGLCPICRYNLSGNVSGVCPECGTPVDPELPTSRERRASSRRHQ